MARSARLGWLVVLGSCCLSVGCLFHRPAEWGVPPEQTVEGPPAEQKPPPTAQRPIQSDYQVRPVLPVARLSASVDPPVERVKLEIKPAPSLRERPSAEPLPLPEGEAIRALRGTLDKQTPQAQRLFQQSGKDDRERFLALLEDRERLRGLLEKLSPEQAARIEKQLDELSQQLRQLKPPELKLGEVCFCRTIENFGRYERLPVHHAFEAGSDDQPGERVQVYVEVRNFTSTRQQDHYETRLNSSLEVFALPLPRDEKQPGPARPVMRMDLGTCTDTSQTPRQDYFLNFQFHIPARLQEGLYTLRITVKDMGPPPGQKPTTRMAQRTLDFRVRAPGTGQPAGR
jgi:hypothetical protein